VKGRNKILTRGGNREFQSGGVGLPEKDQKHHEVCQRRAENNMRSAGEGQKLIRGSQVRVDINSRMLERSGHSLREADINWRSTGVGQTFSQHVCVILWYSHFASAVNQFSEVVTEDRVDDGQYGLSVWSFQT
jgi:hypothetical protein